MFCCTMVWIELHVPIMDEKKCLRRIYEINLPTRIRERHMSNFFHPYI